MHTKFRTVVTSGVRRKENGTREGDMGGTWGSGLGKRKWSHKDAGELELLGREREC